MAPKKIIILIIMVFIGFAAKPAPAVMVEAWTAVYDGPAGGMDLATAQAMDAAGNVYVTGFSIGGTTDYDYATVSYGPDGGERWSARYDGTGGYDAAAAAAAHPRGGVVVTGNSFGGNSGYDYATILYDGSGEALWADRYDGPDSGSDYATALAVDDGGSIVVTGYSFSTSAEYDFATVKYASDGSRLWTARYDGPSGGSDYATAVAVDPRGNVYVTGFSRGANSYDYATVAYDADGREMWTARYNGPGDGYDAPSAIALDAAGNVHVTGQSVGGGTDDFVTVKYASDGRELWVARYNGSTNGYDAAAALALDSAGNVHVAGTSSGGTTHYDYAVVKYGPAGDLLWTARYNGPDDDFDEAVAMAVDPAGNVFVTGSSEYADDIITVQYDRSGMEVWSARCSRPGSPYDSAAAISVDDRGDVVVTGISGNDYTTVKYAPQLSSPTPYEYTYHVPYFSAQTGYWTGLGLKNGSPFTEAAVRIVLHRADGTVQGIEEVVVPPGGQHSGVVGEGLPGEGWIRIYADQPLFGLAFIGTEAAENTMADIPFTNECATDITLPHVAQGPVYDTAVMVCNPGDQDAEVTLTFVDTEGVPRYETTRILAASGSWKYPLASLVPDPTTPNKGSIAVSSSSPVTAFGLYDNLKTGGFCFAGINGMPPGADTSSAYEYIVPYFNDQAPYWTGLGLKNGNLLAEASVAITIYDGTGAVQGRGELTLPPAGQHAAVVGQGLLDEGWMRIRSDRPLQGLSFIGTDTADNYMADIPFTTACATAVELPHVAQGPVYDTTVLVCNPNDQETAVTLTFVDASGTALYEATRVVPAEGSWKYPLAAMVPNPEAPNKGSIEVLSTAPIAAFGLYNNLKTGGYCFAGINGVGWE